MIRISSGAAVVLLGPRADLGLLDRRLFNPEANPNANPQCEQLLERHKYADSLRRADDDDSRAR